MTAAAGARPVPGWQRYLTDDDHAVLAAAGYGGRVGLGDSVALLVVDVTYGFCGDAPLPILESIATRKLSCGQPAWQAVDVIAQLVEIARANGVPVVYTRPDPARAGSAGGRWEAKNVRRDSERSDGIVDEIAPAPGEVVIVKEAPSGFFGTTLMSHLTALGVDSLLVCGGTTSGCVRATVVDAFSYNLKVSVVADGTFDRVPASHWMSLFDMQLKYADVRTISESRAALERQPAPNTELRKA